MTADPEAATLIHDYVQRQEPPLDRKIIDAMRKALQVAASSGGGYLAVPETVRNRCLELCFALEKQDDKRLIDILNAADARARAGDAETIMTSSRASRATIAKNRSWGWIWISTRNAGRDGRASLRL